MSMMQLSDEDVALLRWTCELFFVPESPLAFLDAEAREPKDFAGTYAELVKKGVLDDATFRLTDLALNRLAPLTECDARVVLMLPPERGGRARARDFYLLDEIAVEYEEQDQFHTVGPDQDHQELVASLARRFMPRRSGGDYLNLKLTPGEFMVLSVLCHKTRQGTPALSQDALLAEVRPALEEGKASTLSGTRKHAREKALRDAPAMRHRAAAMLAAAAHDPSPMQDVTAKASQPVSGEPTHSLKVRSGGIPRPAPASEDFTDVDRPLPKRPPAPPVEKTDPQDGPDAADLALQGLLTKGAVISTPRGLELRPSVASFANGISERQRHTFVRFDFSDDEWFMRETSFLATDGSLYVLHAEPDTGMLSVVELDGKRLETWLGRAVGPLPPSSPDDAPGKSGKDFMLRA